jgi:LacI family transcriptional regulator
MTQIRMKDVAAAAGCTTMTVSLALRNSPQVSRKTRDRISRLAKKMGYRPDPFVSALITGRNKPRQVEADVLAVLTKFNVPLGRSKNISFFYAELWEGLKERSTELGFRLEEFSVYSDPIDGPRLTNILKTRGIRGIILFPGGGLDRSYPALDWNHFVTVAAAFHASRVPVHRIASDHSLAMEIALSEIERRGYQRPGLAMTAELDPLIRYAMSGRFF